MGKFEYKGGKVIQRWRDSSGYVRLSHVLMSFLLTSQETTAFQFEKYLPVV